MRKFGGLVALVVLVAAAAVVFSTTQLGQDSAAPRYTTWHAYGGGAHSSQFTGLDQINKSNVSQLEVAWTYPVSGTIMFNPIVVDGVMYTLGSGNAVVALDAATGREIWTRPNQGGVGARGFNYWESADRADRRILYLNAGHLTAINAMNGEVIVSFGTEGRVDLREALQQSGREARNPLQTSNPGRIFEDIFIISLPAQGASYESTPGNVQAYDVRTGALRWVFHAIPHEGEFGADTWPEGHFRTGGGVHNWAELTVDEARGIAFIPFGSPRFDFFGGDRRGDNLFGNSIVALNARTGERLWHFQTIHHDLWDYDLPNAPKLLTIQQDGRSIDVVAQVSKQGLIFVFERETGRPIWPIEDRPVPQSDVPGEYASPTQPFPTRPPPFGRNTFTVDDINPFLPEAEQASLRERFQHWRNEGLYTPPSFEGSVQMPGHNGGANWGSVGVDPIRGHLYVVSKNMPTLLRLTSEVTTAAGAMGGGAPSPIVTREQADRMREAAQEIIERGESIRYGSPYDFIQSPTYGMTAIGPPWSEITAYDLNTGEIKWRRPHGTVVPPADADITIPEDAGSHMPRGGPLVTAGGLVFVATASDRTLRAYDRDTGEVVWSMDLPTGSEGVPASYEVNGRQFLVFPVAAGSGTFSVRFGPPAGRGGGRGAGADAQAGGRATGADGRLHGAGAAGALRTETGVARVRRATPIIGRVVPGMTETEGVGVKRILATIAVGALVAAVGTWATQSGPAGGAMVAPVPEGDWITINRDHAAGRYSPLTEITPANVRSLTEAWRFDTGGGATQVPLVVDGVMYVAGRGRIIAIDGDAGTEVWSHTVAPPRAPTAPAGAPAAAPAPQGGDAGAQAAQGGRGGRGGGGGPAVASISNRGVGYWPGDVDHGPRILFMSGNRLMAVDATTGEAITSFGENGAVTMTPPYGGTPSIYRHVAIVGAAVGEVPQGPPGNPRAFDVRTGEKLWEFRTVPGPGEPFNETWGDGWEDRSGANMWAFSAPVDVERGIAYLPIAGPATNYWGGDRPGDNVFANSIVAVELETGQYIWHFQTVHHDIWDIDLPSAGALFDFVHEDGRRTPAIAHVGKTSYFYVLDRVTGEPLIPVEERPVPQGDVPTEWYSPTQPFPVRPGPLSRVSFDPETDFVRPQDTTPEHVEACRIFMERSGGFYNAGPFTPFLYRAPDAPPRSTIQLPGGTGGVNWGGVAVDPTTGLVFANAQNTSLVGWVEDKPEGVTYSFEAVGSNHPYDRASVDGVGPFFSFQAPLNGYDEEGRARPGGSLPCYRPPWSTLVAVNANSGEIVWESVLGLRESLPEGKQLVGSSGSAGPSVTAGGLVFVGATSDGRFRAFDAKSGEQLWETRVPATANANPMSYAGRSGKQYVAVMAGTMVMVYSLGE